LSLFSVYVLGAWYHHKGLFTRHCTYWIWKYLCTISFEINDFYKSSLKVGQRSPGHKLCVNGNVLTWGKGVVWGKDDIHIKKISIFPHICPLVCLTVTMSVANILLRIDYFIRGRAFVLTWYVFTFLLVPKFMTLLHAIAFVIDILLK
jgi:hypothetical protein